MDGRLAHSQPQLWETKSALQKFNTMGTWFLGPKGENHALLKKTFDYIVDESCRARRNYFPSDPNFITEDMQDSPDFSDGVKAINEVLEDLSKGLAEHSTPFYSPRYAAHMSFDVSLPAVIGCLAAMQYNQNNLTPESSPFTSIIEHKVGLELCSMLGFNVQKPLSEALDTTPDAWGHITSGGSVANLESMWVARNLKYYPLSLKKAMSPHCPLAFAAGSFTTTTCTGESKLFASCSTWELLNLTPTEVVDIPIRLTSQFGISQTTLDRVLDPYNIQTVGKHNLDMEFGIDTDHVPQYLLSKANHYSWLKSAALTGIGKGNVIEVPLTEDARMDERCLEDELERHLNDRRAVYAVVAIIGTTEHGAVDPLDKIVEIRERMQKRGLSFMIHCDAAWGGYFASMKVPKRREPLAVAVPSSPSYSAPSTPSTPSTPGTPDTPFMPTFNSFSSTPSTPATSPPTSPAPDGQYAFAIPLSDYTNTQMLALRFADSITIDPHKSGYNPHSAGALCYRDKRFRYLTTWTSPYLSANTGDESSVGIYGVEGSKSGSTPVGVWMALKVMKQSGYADLLGVTMLTGKKMYANWATITLDSKSLVVTPFLQLPSERAGLSPAEIHEERIRIRDRILLQPNALLEQDDETLQFMQELGSDLMINPFACNFHVNGKLNADVVEASFLNRRLFKRFSVSRIREGEAGLNEKPLILMPMKFLRGKYGDVLSKFKERMGLVESIEGDVDEELYALSNVSMSPWPTANGFLKTMAEAFKRVAEEEIQTTLVRVLDEPSMHSFVVHGKDDLFLVYIGSFNVERYRRQVIVKAKLSDPSVFSKLQEERNKNPNVNFTLHVGLGTLPEMLEKKEWVGDIYEGLPTVYGNPFLSNISIDVEIVMNNSLHRSNLGNGYPTGMPFYLFGTSTEMHIEHALHCAPNAQLTASCVKLSLDSPCSEGGFSGKVLVLDDLREDMMQPFTFGNQPTFFSANATFHVSVYDNLSSAITDGAIPLASGTMTLPEDKGRLFVDFDVVNLAAASEIYISSPRACPSPCLDDVAYQVVSLFHEQKILWDDNVANAIYRLCPMAKHFSVTLGSRASGHHGADVKILSRFVGVHGS
ncbi:hypothetical protein V5O48_008886 [Marasmius crinis-equi]|uniref:PLP-dependent transferase n=1 Tax=Marasmius crinis-equi TaxID=585013 RepID=A0ABR3FDA6_9AGAR